MSLGEFEENLRKQGKIGTIVNDSVRSRQKTQNESTENQLLTMASLNSPNGQITK